jgi:TRAP-type mannitol/chloroaromatic compound transport system permease small subunit
MQALLFISKKIDRLNEIVGQTISWALLTGVLICSGNALVRYGLNNSSNGWLEIQWYLFAAVFLLGAPYTLRRNEHVRIDVVTGRFSKRTQVGIDLFGFIFFLLPITALILYLGIPYAWHSIQNQEMSSNAGGLIVWPAKLLIPLGFLLMLLQGLSEIIKRIAFLRGLIDASAFEKKMTTPEEDIADLKSHIVANPTNQKGDAV